MVFFLDRNLPEALARMLGNYDRKHTVIWLDDKFDKSATDPEWLMTVAKWDPVPVVVSGDGRILKNPAERRVLRGLPLTCFFFAPGWFDFKWHDFAWKAIKVWPEIVRSAQPRHPSIFRVPVSAAKVELIGATSSI